MRHSLPLALPGILTAIADDGPLTVQQVAESHEDRMIPRSVAEMGLLLKESVLFGIDSGYLRVRERLDHSIRYELGPKAYKGCYLRREILSPR